MVYVFNPNNFTDISQESNELKSNDIYTKLKHNTEMKENFVEFEDNVEECLSSKNRQSIAILTKAKTDLKNLRK